MDAENGRDGTPHLVTTRAGFAPSREDVTSPSCRCGGVATVLIPAGFTFAGEAVCGACALSYGTWFTDTMLSLNPWLRAA